MIRDSQQYTVQPLYNEGPSFVISRFFSIYFTITGVNKIVGYTKDFVISRFVRSKSPTV